MRRLAFILYSLDAGGVERMTLHLAEYFIKHGYRVDLIVINPKGEYAAHIPAGVRVISLSKKQAKAAVPAMISYFRKQKPDIIFSAKDYLNVLVIFAKKVSRSNATLLVSSRVHLSEQARQNPSSEQMKKWVKRTYRYADHVIGVSKGVADDIQMIADLPIVHTIYNPVVTTELTMKMNQRVDHPFFSADEKNVFLAVGRLHEQKDYQTLIDAFAIVHEHLPDTCLLFVGDGDEKEALQKKVANQGLNDCVSFVGYQSNPYSYMKQADVFVLSSLYEGFGNVIVEAMAAGTQVVSTNCPSGPKEILANGTYGHLVPVGDAHELAMAMECALLQPISPAKLLERAQQFTVEACAEQYAQLWFDHEKESSSLR